MSTRSFVPRADGEGSIGTEVKNWGSVYTKELYAANIHNESEDRQPGQIYNVGDVTTAAELSSGKYLQCVEGGTAGSGPLVIPDSSVGSLVQDGEVLWKILSYTYGPNVLTRSTQYSEGDLRYCPALPSGMYLVCTTGGTTGAQEPTAALSVAIDGAQIVDGTVTWTACSINQYYVPMLFRNKAYAVGDIAYSRNLPSYLRLECVSAGTTGTTEPDFSTSTGGV